MSIDAIDGTVVIRPIAEVDELYDEGVAMQNRGTLVIAEAVRRARDAYGHDFPAWYQARELDKERVYKLCQAADAVRWAVTNWSPDALANEGQARALAAVPEGRRAEVLDAVAADGKVTAAAITKAWERLSRPAIAPPAPQGPASQPSPPTPEPVRVTTTQTTSETHVVDPATGEVLDEPLDFEADDDPEVSEQIERLNAQVAAGAPTPEHKRRRLPLTDSFRDATCGVTKAIEKCSRLMADDRLPQNAQKVAEANLSDLQRAQDALHGVIEQIKQSQEKSTQ